MTREEAINHLKDILAEATETEDAVCYVTNEDAEALEMAIEALKAQKTGHWIDKSRGEQKNSECSECHTLFRVLIHDYPYCPICGSRNRGDEE